MALSQFEVQVRKELFSHCSYLFLSVIIAVQQKTVSKLSAHPSIHLHSIYQFWQLRHSFTEVIDWPKMLNILRFKPLERLFSNFFYEIWISFGFGLLPIKNNHLYHQVLCLNKTNLNITYSVFLLQLDPAGVTLWSSFSFPSNLVFLQCYYSPVTAQCLHQWLKQSSSTWRISDTLVLQLLGHEITSAPPPGS